MKKIVFIFALSIQFLFSNGQDSVIKVQQHYISVSSDLIQYALYQPNIGGEYRMKDRYLYGINIGIVIPDPLFTVNVLADGQYKMPGTVYHGIAARFYYKYYRIKKPKGYWCTQLVVKDLWFNSVNFTDQPDGDNQFNYTMSEKSVVLGLEFLHGHEWGQQSGIYADFFYGIGVHARLRDFNVTSSTDPYPGSYLAIGTYKGYICYPTPVLGLKIGFKIH